MPSNVTEIEVYEGDDGWRWRAKAGNGETVATGEQHGSFSDARRAAQDVFPGVPIIRAQEADPDGGS